ncbi:MAG: UbiX family flavin prenyltransferase [Candidatus Sumerlaeia bacterium]|nr:UbiX family flavin prenyltransferase [Candidatus Sumerlaeia bacterium]
MESHRVVVGLAGASGTAYGIRLIERLVALDHEVQLLVSASTWKVMQAELGLRGLGPSSPLTDWIPGDATRLARQVHTYNIRDIAAPMASGTFRARGMIVMPASMKTVAAIAHGYSDNLLTRCADCFLKERRPLVVVPRETPLSTIHLRNLLTLAEAGAHVVPAMPGFYHKPETIDDLVDFMVMKVLELLDIEHQYEMAWKGLRPEED